MGEALAMSEVIKSPKAPAWVGAITTLVVGVIAVYAFASTPSEDTLKDHETRIRTLERLSTEQLSTINARLESMDGRMERLSTQIDRSYGRSHYDPPSQMDEP